MATALIADAAWILAGGFSALTFGVGSATLAGRKRQAARTARQVECWNEVSEAARRLTWDVRDGSEMITTMLRSKDTRDIAVDALADAARGLPNIEVLRLCNSDSRAILLRWVTSELESGDPGRRAHALEVAGSLRLWNCRGLMAGAARDDSPTVRVAACRALGAIDPATAVGVLLGVLEEDGAWAADLLGDVLVRAGEEGMRAVVARVQRWAATPALVGLAADGRMDGSEELLVSALGKDDDDTALRAAEGLADVGSSDAVPSLLRLLRSPNEAIRLSVLTALGRIGAHESLLELTRCLGDPSRPVRFAAASALAQTPGGREALVRAADSSDELVVEAATLAIWYLDRGALPGVVNVTEAGVPSLGGGSGDPGGNIDGDVIDAEIVSTPAIGINGPAPAATLAEALEPNDSDSSIDAGVRSGVSGQL